MLNLTLNPTLLVLYISMGIDMLLYAGIAGYLIYRALHTKYYALIHLAIALILIDICFILYIALGGATTIYHFFRTLGIAWFLIFNHQMFLKGQKSRTLYFSIYALLILVAVVVSYSVYANDNSQLAYRQIPDALFGLLTIIIAEYQYNSSNTAYLEIKDRNIEPYIKKRYLLFQFGCIFLSFTGLFSLLIAFYYDTMMVAYLFILVSLSSFVYLITNFIVWVMPSKIKKRLNGDWQQPQENIESMESMEESLSEEELMAQFMEED